MACLARRTAAMRKEERREVDEAAVDSTSVRSEVGGDPWNVDATHSSNEGCRLSAVGRPEAADSARPVDTDRNGLGGLTRLYDRERSGESGPYSACGRVLRLACIALLLLDARENREKVELLRVGGSGGISDSRLVIKAEP